MTLIKGCEDYVKCVYVRKKERRLQKMLVIECSLEKNERGKRRESKTR
jgi:hypothetical protein